SSLPLVEAISISDFEYRDAILLVDINKI
ncbi:MAG: hypothetical protein ACI8ZQ_001603, partial [Bacteroidia bacterium]